MNENRSVFSFQAIPGMLIATVLLLSILVVLTYLGIVAQQDVMQKPFESDRAEFSTVKMYENTDVENKVMRSKE